MVGPPVFDLEEANRLVPELDTVFDELDRLRERLRALHLRVNALELIWGEAVQQADNPDHGELQHHLEEMKRIQTAFEGAARHIADLGGQVKSLEPGLVDFYGVRDGRLVFWCWQRGEGEITHWHHIDEGFAGREPV